MKVLQLVKTSVGATWAWEQMCELQKAGARISVILPGEGPMVERYRDSGRDRLTVNPSSVWLKVSLPMSSTRTSSRQP
jgi:hypothetical protein